jgi:hypothetical protein
MNSADDVPAVKSEQRTMEKKGTSEPRASRSGVRLAAIRRAREVKTARDARLRVRELDVETTLSQYYEGVTASEEIMERATVRAREILTDAERAAAAPRRAAKVAMRRLKDLGEDRASLVELTGLSLAQVRELLTDTEQPTGQQTAEGPEREHRPRATARPDLGGQQR